MELNAIIAGLQGLETKDRLTLFVGCGALCISLFSLLTSLLSYKQRSREGLLATRKQLSDTMQKLLDLNTETAKQHLEPDKYPGNYGGLINDQRRFHARLAHALIQRLSFDVSRWELLLIGRAFTDLTDYDLAERMFRRAIKRRTSIVEDVTVIRGYVRFLFMTGKTEGARDQIKAGLAKLAGSGQFPFEEGFTLESWAILESNFGDQSNSNTLLHSAIQKYQNDTWASRRTAAIERVMQNSLYEDCEEPTEFSVGN